MDRLSCGFEYKFANPDNGTFSGYGAVFGNVDSYGDVIAPGAFATSLAATKAVGRSLSMYMQHGAALGGDPRPVGVWTNVAEDSKGLFVEGKLVGLDTEAGKYNYALMKEGAMTGLSIGYRTIKADYGKTAADPKRTIKVANVHEVSVVDNPANALARVDSLKSAEDIKTIREFEDFLRDVGGFSHTAAKAIAAGGYKAKSELRDEDESGAELVTLIKRAAAMIHPK